MKKLLNKLNSWFDRLLDCLVDPMLYRLWMFTHNAHYDKVGDAYINGQKYYRDLLRVFYEDGMLPVFLDMQRNGAYEAIGFELGAVGDGFYAFDTLGDAELWSADGNFPNSRAIVPLYAIVANNFVELFRDENFFGQTPS